MASQMKKHQQQCALLPRQRSEFLCFSLDVLRGRAGPRSQRPESRYSLLHQDSPRGRPCVTTPASAVIPLSVAAPQGTADAVRQYMWLFDEAVRDGVEDFLILSGTMG